MAINTVLLDLSVDPQKVAEKCALQSTIQKVLSNFIPELKEEYSICFEGKGFLTVFTAVRGTFVTVRGFPEGLVSIDIEYYLQEEDHPLLPFETVRRLEGDLTKCSGSIKSHKYPALKRGEKIDRYLNSTDDRLLEYDIDAVVFEEQSQYQKVQIVHSVSFGNILFLDRILNMSERDLIYTETLMQRGKEDYSGKEIVILGGGDGGLLCELLKENPKFVSMSELDEVVLRACREHLRGCCGNCLDQLEGTNYKIVVDDCIKSLDAMIAEGKEVDYVFGDLTDIPVSTSPHGEVWDFIRLILNKSMQVLKPTGKYMTHSGMAWLSQEGGGNPDKRVPTVSHITLAQDNSVSRPVTLAMFEDQLNNLKIPVDFTTDRAFIPSFLEDWMFYQIWPKQVD